MVTFTGVIAALELQFTTMGDELTVSCPLPEIPAIVAVIATGPPTFTVVARPLALTVAIVPVAGLHVAAGAPATVFPRPSRGTAANCWVVHRGLDALAGNTETLATAC
jgi:hypothetical protein